MESALSIFLLFLFQIETEAKGCMVAYLRYTYSTCTITYVNARLINKRVHRYPAYQSDLRTPLPHFCSNHTPPRHGTWCGLEMLIDLNSCLPGRVAWAEDSQEITKNVYLWALVLQLLLWEATEWWFYLDLFHGSYRKAACCMYFDPFTIGSPIKNKHHLHSGHLVLT